MKRDLSISIPTLAPFRWTATFTLAAALLALASQTPSAHASPPTPREVANHVHKRVSGIFFKVARVLEGGPTDEDEAYKRERREREREREARYLNDRYDDRSTGIRNPELEPYTPPPPGYRSDSDIRRESGPRYLPPHTSDDEWKRREAQREAQLQQEERNFERQQRSQSQGQGRTEYYTPDLANPDESMDRDRSRDRASNPASSPGLNLRQRGSESRSSTDTNIPSQQSNPSADSRHGSASDNINRPDPTADPRKNSANSTVNQPGTQPKASYATPVPNKEGFVYPPGVKQEPANMLDIRGLSSGQKARDPRTGNVFLVP